MDFMTTSISVSRHPWLFCLLTACAPSQATSSEPKEPETPTARKPLTGVEKAQHACCGRHPAVRYLDELGSAVIDGAMMTQVEKCARGKFDVTGIPVNFDVEGCLSERIQREPALIRSLAAQIDEASKNVADQVPGFTACIGKTRETFAECGKCKCEEQVPGTGPSVYRADKGQVLRLDGASAHVVVPFREELVLRDKVTLEAWVRLEGWFGDNYFPILDRAWRLEATKESIGFTAGYRAGTTVPVVLQQDRWTHVAVTYSTHRKRARWYIDGKLIAESPYAEAFLENEYDNPSSLHIGRGPTGGDEYARGYFDEVRIWNVERSAAEIEAHLNASVPADSPGLVGYWKFDELADSVARDASKNDLDGTLVGGFTHVAALETE
jgi:hypothetical protein